MGFAVGVMGYGWEEALDTPMPFLVAGQRGRVKYDTDLARAVFGRGKRGPQKAGPDQPAPLRSKSALLGWAKRTNSRFQKKPKQTEAVNGNG